MVTFGRLGAAAICVLVLGFPHDSVIAAKRIMINGVPITVWDTQVRSNRPITKHVRRGDAGEARQLVRVCEYLISSYSELLANQIWMSRSGSQVEASLVVHNPKWIRLKKGGKTIEVDNEKLSDESRELVERLNNLREVKNLYRRNQGRINSNLASAVEETRDLVEEKFGDLDSLEIEMQVIDLINRATIAEYQNLVNQLTIRMMVAEHFAAMITESTSTVVSAEEVNRKLMSLKSSSPGVITNSVRVRQRGFGQTITVSKESVNDSVDTNQITVKEYVDAVIDLMVNGAGKPKLPQHNKTSLPTPILKQ